MDSLCAQLPARVGLILSNGEAMGGIKLRNSGRKIAVEKIKRGKAS
jgi:hypothetical protein